MERVLRARLVADVVFEIAVRGRHAAVVVADAPLHFREDLRLQRVCGGEGFARIGVLGFQMGADVRAQERGVAQHLLPVVVLHPAIVVGPRAAELLDRLGVASRDGRRGQAGHSL